MTTPTPREALTAEQDAWERLRASVRLLVKGYGMQSTEGDRLTGRAYLMGWTPVVWGRG